jgi:hypothetical protein
LVEAPDIVPGVAGMLYTVNVRAALNPKQFCDLTLNVPLAPKFEAKETATVCVPWPDTIVALVGAVHK